MCTCWHRRSTLLQPATVTHTLSTNNSEKNVANTCAMQSRTGRKPWLWPLRRYRTHNRRTDYWAAGVLTSFQNSVREKVLGSLAKRGSKTSTNRQAPYPAGLGRRLAATG